MKECTTFVNSNQPMSFKIHTYHCLCTSLLLATTHTLSSLPRRSLDLGSPDSALILPINVTPPIIEGPGKTLSSRGYSLLCGIEKDAKIKILRKENGFERRFLYRCSRCRVVVGYELSQVEMEGNTVGSDTTGEGQKSNELDVIYLLPGGMMSTEALASKRLPFVDDVQVGEGVNGAFE
ncbi:hypothetical protein K3495_g8324 [Podosphaera aphanis]|nr:hypothetical protein K3495_g8324 [Podosphaera aphanis]